MANVNAPFGLSPVRHLFGMTPRLSEYTIADGYNTALYIGDPVACTGTGRNIGIATASTSSVVTGVFQGCKYINALGDTIFSKYWPASQAIKAGTVAIAEVIDDPFVVYEIQSDVTGIAEADIRLLTNLASGTGNAGSGSSGWYSTGVSSTENQLKILGLSAKGTNAYGAYAIIEVLLNTHEFNNLSTVEV